MLRDKVWFYLVLPTPNDVIEVWFYPVLVSSPSSCDVIEGWFNPVAFCFFLSVNFLAQLKLIDYKILFAAVISFEIIRSENGGNEKKIKH